MESFSVAPAAPSAAPPAEPRWWHGPWGLAGLAAAAYCVLFISWTFTHWGGEASVTLIGDLAQIPMAFFAALTAWRVGQTPSAPLALRRAWQWLAVAQLAGFTGEVLWFNYEILQGVNPFPSWADLGYLAFYPLMLIGLLNLPYAPLARADRLRLFLDAAVVMLAGGTLIWQFVLGPTASGFMPSLEGWLAVAYPVADLAIVFGLVYLLFRHPLASRRSGFGYLVAAMLLFVLADTVFGFQSLQDAYLTGGPLDSVWTISYCCFALAALQQSAALAAQDTHFQPARRWPGVWLLPYAGLALVGGLVLWQFGQAGLADPVSYGSLVALILLAALISLRQALDVRENRRLNDELRLRLAQLDEAGSALNRAQHLAGIGTLAAGVAHEINNPLSVIITHVEAIQRRRERGLLEADYLHTALERIERAAWQGARIARALLTYARGAELTLSRASARDMALEAAARTSLPPDAQIDIRVTVAPDTPEVICDREQIIQVLINLLDNARDAMTGPGTIGVTANRARNGGLLLVVSDSGTGLSAEAQSRVFDPFYTTKAVGKGTGLGLSICRGIVRAHDGEIEIDSVVGGGTRVSVHLPLEPRPTAG